jgi:hypothetical protein
MGHRHGGSGAIDYRRDRSELEFFAWAFSLLSDLRAQLSIDSLSKCESNFVSRQQISAYQRPTYYSTIFQIITDLNDQHSHLIINLKAEVKVWSIGVGDG